MLENDIDGDDDIINPFNIVSEPDVDTYVELDDQEEDTEEGWYKCCVGRWGMWWYWEGGESISITI